MRIYTDKKPNEGVGVLVICPEDYKVVTVSKSVAYPGEPWEEIVKCRKEEADLRKGEKLYIFHQEDDEVGVYIAKSQSQSYWNYYCAIGATKLYSLFQNSSTH